MHPANQSAGIIMCVGVCVHAAVYALQVCDPEETLILFLICAFIDKNDNNVYYVVVIVVTKAYFYWPILWLK